MKVASLTHNGQERSRNEDSYLTLSVRSLALLAVADGMGGHQAGDVASNLAVNVLERFWSAFDFSEPLPDGGFAAIIQNLIVEANKLILNESAGDDAKGGMGTTLTAALVTDGKVYIGHVGDSRAYLIKGSGEITQLTSDHSLLRQLLQQGSITPEEAEGHPQRHILTRALGTQPEVEVDLVETDLSEDSMLLLCTDGLTSLVRDEEIRDLVLEMKDDLQGAASALINLANERGGYDNITVVLAADMGRRVV